MMIVPFYPLLCKKRTFSYTVACVKLSRITSLPEAAKYSANVLNAAFKKFNSLGICIRRLLAASLFKQPGKEKKDDR